MSNHTIDKAKRHITPALVYHTDIVAVKAGGIYVESADGRRYMDFSSGLATVNIGHCHPDVVKAASAQAGKFIHSGCIFRYNTVADLAEKLSEITPEKIEKFFFSNSGAEAVEGAIKLARYHTGRQGVIAFLGGFHGRTLGALSLTASSSRYRKRYHSLLSSVYHAAYPYCYRCPAGQKTDNCRQECLRSLENIFKYQISPEEVACMIIEPVLGEGGYMPAPVGYMKKLRDICSKNGILLIADEVQSGFGRTGRWFACEQSGINPDIITMAKGIASGFPLSAVGASADIMDGWEPGAHGTTFGGNPVSCAASLATINAIERDGLLENATQVGAHAFNRLLKMKAKRPQIGDVRGHGLMIGIEFIEEDGAPAKGRLKKIMAKCLLNGLVIIECGSEKNIARFMPPLITTMEEMDRALAIFEEALVD